LLLAAEDVDLAALDAHVRVVSKWGMRATLLRHLCVVEHPVFKVSEDAPYLWLLNDCWQVAELILLLMIAPTGFGELAWLHSCISSLVVPLQMGSTLLTSTTSWILPGVFDHEAERVVAPRETTNSM
jgi:hypothetical protein